METTKQNTKARKRRALLKLPRKDSIERECYLAGPYITQGHWLFDTTWLEARKGIPKRMLKFLKLVRVNVVTRKVKGEDVRDVSEQLNSIIPTLDQVRKNYVRVTPPPKDFQAFIGSETSGTQHALLTHEGRPCVAISKDYFEALHFCGSTEVYAHRDCTWKPIVLLNEERIVGLIMPIRIEGFRGLSNE